MNTGDFCARKKLWNLQLATISLYFYYTVALESKKQNKTPKQSNKNIRVEIRGVLISLIETL